MTYEKYRGNNFGSNSRSSTNFSIFIRFATVQKSPKTSSDVNPLSPRNLGITLKSAFFPRFGCSVVKNEIIRWIFLKHNASERRTKNYFEEVQLGRGKNNQLSGVMTGLTWKKWKKMAYQVVLNFCLTLKKNKEEEDRLQNLAEKFSFCASTP